MEDGPALEACCMFEIRSVAWRLVSPLQLVFCLLRFGVYVPSVLCSSFALGRKLSFSIGLRFDCRTDRPKDTCNVHTARLDGEGRFR